MRLGGLENGVEEEPQFRREVLRRRAGGGAGKCGEMFFRRRTGEHVEQEAAGFVDGAGFHKLRFSADREHA